VSKKMAINPISSSITNLLSAEPLASAQSALPSGGSFADILTEAMNTVAVTDAADKASGLALLAGQTDDMAGLLIDSQKAEIALSLALSLRNKVLEAYTEIMRMQV
jgi:flagellar hook-basal body complex protein FliE